MESAMNLGNFTFDLPTAKAASPEAEETFSSGASIASLESEETDLLNIPQVKEQNIRTEQLKRNNFFEKPSKEDVIPMDFASLNLSKQLLKACEALNYRVATPIQAAAIPLILAGRDICGSAITGSGKTAAFGLPLIERLLFRHKGSTTTYVVIVAPTRELAVQIHSVMTDLAQFTDIQVALIVGGFSLQVQSATLDARPEIIVATPGRLIDHLRNSRSFDLDDVHALVLDEADKLLKLGFIEEIKEILKYLPGKRQTMLFSATMTEEVKKLMQLSLNKPVRLAADPSGRVPRKLKQEIVRIKGEAMRKNKEAILCALCSRTFLGDSVIIFCSTKQRAHRIKLLFEMLRLPPIGELHSNLSQMDRLDALEKFKSKELSYLVATDVAGRGLDIVGVDVVINYDAPPSIDTYLHRIGRTARAGAEGKAVTFITDINRQLLHEITSSTRQKLSRRVVPEEVVAYYKQQWQLHERHLQLVEKEEKEKEKLNHAEIEAERVVHTIEHEREIMSRPKRTWFQTSSQRKTARRLALLEDLKETEGSEHLEPLSTAKSKKPKKGEKDARQKSEMAETNGLKGRLRAIKRQHRLLESQGSDTRQANRLANASESKGKRHHTPTEEPGFLRDPTEIYKKRRKTRRRMASKEEEGKTRVYAGGRKTGRASAVKGRDRQSVNSVKRGGKGKHAFKGKRKYKRR